MRHVLGAAVRSRAVLRFPAEAAPGESRGPRESQAWYFFISVFRKKRCSLDADPLRRLCSRADAFACRSSAVIRSFSRYASISALSRHRCSACSRENSTDTSHDVRGSRCARSINGFAAEHHGKRTETHPGDDSDRPDEVPLDKDGRRRRHEKVETP